MLDRPKRQAALNKSRQWTLLCLWTWKVFLLWNTFFICTFITLLLVYLSVTLLLSIRLPQLLQVSDRAARFYQDFLCAFCVRRVGRLSQIQELVPFLAPEPDPVQMLPHGRHRLATLYLSMTTNEAGEEERKAVTALDTMFVDLMSRMCWVFFFYIFEQCE